MVAVDRKTGRPVPAIARVQLVNGNGWPEVATAEGVTMDDFVFGAPVAGQTNTPPRP